MGNNLDTKARICSGCGEEILKSFSKFEIGGPRNAENFYTLFDTGELPDWWEKAPERRRVEHLKRFPKHFYHIEHVPKDVEPEEPIEGQEEVGFFDQLLKK